jgi:hypothetical protein
MREPSHADGWAPAAWEGIGQLEDQPEIEAQTLQHASHEDYEESSRASRQ